MPVRQQQQKQLVNVQPAIFNPQPQTQTQSGGALDVLLASIHDINMNPYILGSAYILLNLGGRFMVMSVTPAQEAFLQDIVFRPLLLFAIMFIGTRNLVVAFWMTILIHLILHYFLNENSTWYLLRDWTATGSATGISL
jgi:hypothetical protein